jgi:hypothetical protein
VFHRRWVRGRRAARARGVSHLMMIAKRETLVLRLSQANLEEELPHKLVKAGRAGTVRIRIMDLERGYEEPGWCAKAPTCSTFSRELSRSTSRMSRSYSRPGTPPSCPPAKVTATAWSQSATRFACSWSRASEAMAGTAFGELKPDTLADRLLAIRETDLRGLERARAGPLSRRGPSIGGHRPGRCPYVTAACARARR